MGNSPFNLKDIGPGLVIAATGLGACDLIAASVAGAKYGTTILWAALLGALMKYVLTEGLARWQLKTGSTLLEGWVQRLPRIISIYFFIYLLFWSFIVAGALIAGTGLAAHAIYPGLSVEIWGIIHSLAALVLVLIGRYSLLETAMKFFIVLMFFTVLICAAWVAPGTPGIISGLLIPTVPEGSIVFIFSVIGGVGGSVTLLAYGYWIREKGWRSTDSLGMVRIDLTVGYVLTGLFGIAMLLLAAAVLGGSGALPEGSQSLIACGDAIREATTQRFGATAGGTAAMVFLVGVWGAIFTSTLGVWNGVPYIFADFLNTLRGSYGERVETTGAVYRGFLLFLAFPPMALLFLDRPIWIIKIYTLTGGLFMPLLAGTLLWLNSRRSLVGEMRNGFVATGTLVLALVLFLLIATRQLADML